MIFSNNSRAIKILRKKPKISIKVTLKKPWGSRDNKSVDKTIIKSTIETKITITKAIERILETRFSMLWISYIKNKKHIENITFTST